jgi:hypothetical protein
VTAGGADGVGAGVWGAGEATRWLFGTMGPSPALSVGSAASLISAGTAGVGTFSGRGRDTSAGSYFVCNHHDHVDAQSRLER